MTVSTCPARTEKLGNQIGCKHYWKIDSDNKGVCRNCGEIRQFPTDGKGEVKILKVGELTLIDLAPAIVERYQSLNLPSKESKPLQTHLKTSYGGRPPTGEHRLCKGCGKPIYVRAYRIKKGENYGNYCYRCNKKEQASSIHNAIQGLASHVNRYTLQEYGDRAIAILIKYLRKEPERTVKILLGDNHKTFNEDDLIKATYSLALEEGLKRMPEFECIGDGMWKLKTVKE